MRINHKIQNLSDRNMSLCKETKICQSLVPHLMHVLHVCRVRGDNGAAFT